MGSARTLNAASFISQIDYELRNTNQLNPTAAESLVTLNKMYEMIYMILADMKSELVRTGTGTITTVAGTETYSLSTNSMGDFWMPWRLQVKQYAPLVQVSEDDRWDYKIYEDATPATTTSRARPTMFYVSSGNVGLLPIPDAVYTVYVFYIPNFVPLATSAAGMPFYHLFNQQIGEGMKMLFKNRQESPNSIIDGLLMQMFQKRAFHVARMRNTGLVSDGLESSLQSAESK